VIDWEAPLDQRWNRNAVVISEFMKDQEIAQTCLGKFGLVMASGESLEDLLLDAVAHTAEEGRRLIGGR
jgi:hypothetical protein